MMQPIILKCGVQIRNMESRIDKHFAATTNMKSQFWLDMGLRYIVIFFYESLFTPNAGRFLSSICPYLHLHFLYESLFTHNH